jgi:hypothetical protein
LLEFAPKLRKIGNTYTKALEEILCLSVNLELSTLGLLVVEGRDFGDVLILAFSLLFLEFERDTTDWTTLNTLHQMGSVTGNLFLSDWATAKGKQ